MNGTEKDPIDRSDRSDGLRHYRFLRAPHTRAQINQWRDRDTGKPQPPLIELTPGVDELTLAVAKELMEDIAWLLAKIQPPAAADTPRPTNPLGCAYCVHGYDLDPLATSYVICAPQKKVYPPDHCCTGFRRVTVEELQERGQAEFGKAS